MAALKDEPQFAPIVVDGNELQRVSKILSVEDKQRKLSSSIFRIMQMILDTNAIEQAVGFALCLRCWWMKVRDVPAGLRQSVTSLVNKL